MAQLDPLKTFTELTLGKRVDRATDNITTGETLFNIESGRVIINLIIGEVTTVIETKTVNFKLVSNPDTGTTTDLCGNLDLTAAEAGTLLTITGTASDAMVKGSSGSIKSQIVPVVCAAGAIQATVGDTHTGSIKWSVFYTPIDDGAYIEAA